MDDSDYKSVKTKRGYTYSYYFKPAQSDKPYMLFLMGFPSTSKDWEAQAVYFKEKGYGLVIPDLLGYGGTDKPVDPKEYKMRDMAQDVVDILDHEGMQKVIVVSHDWGAVLASRLGNFFADRLYGAAFLAVGYYPPQPTLDYYAYLDQLKEKVGYDVFGYWEFFSSDDGPTITEKNLDSFYCIQFPKDPMLWRTDMAPRGKIREFIANNRQTGLPSYWDDAGRKAHQKRLMRGGLHGPCQWYAVQVGAYNNEDEAAIPKENWTLNIPVYFGACLKDYICIADLMKEGTVQYCPNLKVDEFDTSHWVMFEEPDKLNKSLNGWVSKIPIN